MGLIWRTWTTKAAPCSNDLWAGSDLMDASSNHIRAREKEKERSETGNNGKGLRMGQGSGGQGRRGLLRRGRGRRGGLLGLGVLVTSTLGFYG